MAWRTWKVRTWRILPMTGAKKVFTFGGIQIIIIINKFAEANCLIAIKIIIMIINCVLPGTG